MNRPSIDSQITFLYTADLQSTADFYENILDLALWLDQGTCRIYQVSADGYLGFCERADVIAEHPDVIFTIVTPKKTDVDEWYQMLKAKGVEFEKAPETNPKYKIYHCFLRDPNGYLIEIQNFL
ncbi:MAG: VOC family protein [Anaerolineales bacterium]|nr:VOC family protein [Chloroflexota bacterium]MBL6982656.1 VOC family protein [Anaerolineales bacterium]